MYPGVVAGGEQGSNELPVFRGVAQIVGLVGRLCRRPRFGDDPIDDDTDARRERRARRGLPLVCLIRPNEFDALLGGLSRKLDAALPGLIDFGSPGPGGHRPANKQISILRVEHGGVQPQPAYLCGDPADPHQHQDLGCPTDQ